MDNLKEWQGKIYHPSLQDGRSECIIVVREKSLVAKLQQDKEFVISFKDSDYKLEGVGNETFAFTHRSEDRFKITTNDKSIIESLELISDFQPCLKRFRAAHRKSLVMKIVIPVTVLILLFVVLPILFFGHVVDIAVSALPNTVDVQLGEAAVDSAIREITGQTSTRSVNEYVRNSIDIIVNRLVTALPDKGFQFKVHIVSSEIVNAFALPGGQIIITTGLILEVESPEEIAGVLAHEISHVTSRHGLRGIAKNMSFWILLSAILGDAGTIGSLILTQAGNLVSLGFSRDMEREADYEGIKLLKTARVDMRGLRKFLLKIKEREKNMPVQNIQLLRTHPLTEDRLADIDSQIEKIGLGNSEPIQIDWVKIINALR